MTAYNIVNPSLMVAGQPEDISQVVANLDAIAAVLNGGLDNSNINAAAGIDYSKLTIPAGAVPASKLAGYPNDVTKRLAGDGSWPAAGAGGGTVTKSGIPPASPADFHDHVLFAGSPHPEVGWPGGVSPPGSHRSRRDSLPSPGSSCSYRQAQVTHSQCGSSAGYWVVIRFHALARALSGRSRRYLALAHFWTW